MVNNLTLFNHLRPSNRSIRSQEQIILYSSLSVQIRNTINWVKILYRQYPRKSYSTKAR